MTRLSRGGFLRTVLVLAAAAAYAVAGAVAWQGRELILEVGEIPSDPIAVLAGPEDPVVGAVSIGGAIVAVQVAGGLLCLAMSVRGPARRPFVPEPCYSSAQRRRLKIGGLLVGGIPLAGTALLVSAFVGGTAVGALGLGALGSLVAVFVYVVGVALVVSVALPPAGSNRTGAVAAFGPPLLVLLDVVVRSAFGGRASPVVVAVMSLAVVGITVVMALQTLPEWVPEVAEDRQQWALFGGLVAAVLAAWAAGGIVLPPLSQPISILLVTATVPIAVAVQGYVAD
jgi:hypothetical protein